MKNWRFPANDTTKYCVIRIWRIIFFSHIFNFSQIQPIINNVYRSDTEIVPTILAPTEANPQCLWHICRLFVGITGLEPATSRPPDVCATNCAKSRTCGCKGTYLLRNNQTFTLLFSKIPLFLMFVCCFCSLHGAGGTSGRRRGTLHGCGDNLQRHGDDERCRPILKISKKMAFILYCLHFALTLCYYIYNKVDAGALVVMLRLAKRTMQYETDIPLHADGSARAHLRRLLE